MEPEKRRLNIGIFTKAPKQKKDSSIQTLLTGHYVTWIESFGHNVIPIPYDLPLPELDKILLQVNGIFFQGSRARIKWPYKKKKKALYLEKYGHLPNECVMQYVVRKCLKKELPTTPLLMICWAMELLPLIIANKKRKKVFITSVGTRYINMNLKDIDRDSKLFSYFTEEDIKELTENKQTYHNHRNSLSVDFFKETKRLDIFKITSTSLDEENLNFVSSYEAIDYPLIALQFHPEKVGSAPKLELSKDPKSVILNRKFAESFFKLCEANTNQLIDQSLILDSNIKFHPEKWTRERGFLYKNGTPYYSFIVQPEVKVSQEDISVLKEEKTEKIEEEKKNNSEEEKKDFIDIFEEKNL